MKNAFKSHLLNPNNLTQAERRLLFGIPVYDSKINGGALNPQGTINSSGHPESSEQHSNEHEESMSVPATNSAVWNKFETKKKGRISRKLLISWNNTYKNVWDGIVLFLTAYSCITTAFV